MLANIKKTFRPMPSILTAAQAGEQMENNVFVAALLAAVIALLGIFSEAIFLLPYMVVKGVLAGVAAAQTGNFQLNMNSVDMTLVQLFATVGATVAMMLYVKHVEKRSLRTMGFVREHAVSDYLIGMVVAFAMFSACVGICMVTGAMVFDGFVLGGRYVMLALFFVGFIIQGMSEETVCRGFMMTSLGSKGGALVGVLFNSLFFGALHLGNSGVTVFSMVNLVLFGLFMSVLVLKLNSIWMACAIHTVWNFVQGNFFGILVSGTDMGPSVFRFVSVPGMGLWNGGSFGMEGGLATSIVLTLATVIVLLLRPRETK